MSIINNGLLLASGADAAVGYQISRSLRFNSADSAYLSRTPGSAGNRKTWTWSAWVKKTATTQGTLFSAYKGSGSVNDEYLGIDFFSDNLRVTGYSTSYKTTTQVFRDPSAWYHIVVAVDTTNATADDRVKLYVNGTQITTFSTVNNPSLNADLGVNQASEHTIGRQTSFGAYFDGYLADIYFLDGTATTPSTFAETDAITGQWVPKTPTSISYGTNGFRLTFSDNSGTTSTTLGKDAAGSNNWTPNNFSVASGSGNDSLVDSPTSYGTDARNGGEVRGNYCTWNPLDQSGITFSNGNLDTTGGGICRATFGLASGKWYWEQTVITKSDGANNPRGGVATASASLTNDLGAAATQWVMFMAGGSNGGKGYNAGTITGSGSAFAVNDVAMFAYDADAGKLWFGRNGTWITGDPAAGTSPFYSSVTAPVFPVAQEGSSSSVVNYGQRAFSYQAPSGFKALCDTNLTAPTIAKPADYFDAKLYTGNGSTLTVSGLNFGPELVWIKSRSNAYDHGLYDAVRGTTKRLVSNDTQAEDTQSGITAFNSDGFTLGSYAGQNGSSATYVAWAWDAAGSNTTDTTGSITSTRRTNATSGCSVVTYTGAGSAGTVGHGLGTAPSLVIVKQRSFVAGGTNWQVYHKDIGNTKSINLNTTGTPNTDIGWWNNASPTSTTFSVGTYNAGAYDFVAYCFAPVAGYSAFGSYTGTNAASNFVYLGFRPALVIIKLSSASSSFGSWLMYDNKRNTYNPENATLWANRSTQEGLRGDGSTAYSNFLDVDFTANGFRVVNASSADEVNWSPQTYIYCAWAESPFQYARAR